MRELITDASRTFIKQSKKLMIAIQEREITRKKISSLRDLDDLAKFLNTSKKQLIYYSIVLPEPKKYKSFDIPKKNGEVRKISAPVKTLKYIQTQLSNKLQEIYEPLNAVHGFVKNYEDKNKEIIKPTIITNADQHKRKRIILNLDLKDFFPTITKNRVYGLFKNQYSINSRIAYYLTHICCTENGLPQGAPTSPIITNLICSRLDRKLRRLSAENYVTYSRYADDLSFSTSRKAFPESFESKVREIIENEGLFINERKRRLHIRENRMEVTGLTVNVKPNVQRKYVRNLRAIFHNIEKKGLVSVADNIVKSKNKTSLKNLEVLKKYLKGKIEFLGQVKGKDDPIFTKFKSKYSEIFSPQIIIKDTQIETTDFADKRDKLLVEYNSEIVASIEVKESDQENIKSRIKLKLDKARKILLSPDKNNYLETVFLLWFSCLNEFQRIHFSSRVERIENNKPTYKNFIDNELIEEGKYYLKYLKTLPGFRHTSYTTIERTEILSKPPRDDNISFFMQAFLIEKMKSQNIIEFAWLNEIRNRLNLTHSDEANIKKSPYYERVSWPQCSWMFQFLYFIFTANKLKIDSVFQDNKYINNHISGNNMIITGIIDEINDISNGHELVISFHNSLSENKNKIKALIWKTYKSSYAQPADDKNRKRIEETELLFNDYKKENIRPGDPVRVKVEFTLNKTRQNKIINNITIKNIEKLSDPNFLAKYEKEN